MDQLTFSQPYRIRSYESGLDWKATLPALCNQLQDIASFHATKLGFGYEDLYPKGQAWVLVRAFLQMQALPSVGETVDVTTWPSSIGRTSAQRDFTLSLNGDIIGHGTSAWAIIDINTRTAIDPTEAMAGRETPNKKRALEFESRAVKRLREAGHTTVLKARRGDEDINGHVNSIRQVEFLLESTPRQWVETHWCMGADVQFRAECHGSDELTALCQLQDDGTAQHALIRATDQREIARMKTWWAKK